MERGGTSSARVERNGKGVPAACALRGRRDDGVAEEDERRRHSLASSVWTGARNVMGDEQLLWWDPLSATPTKIKRLGAQPGQ